MNDTKLKNLFAAARREVPPAATDGFDLLVMQAVRREPARRAATTIFDELNALFPRFAWAAISVIAVCVAGDWLAGAPSLTDGVAQISQQWLLAGNGF